MSVLTPKRLLISAVALLFATATYAAHPSARVYARMAYDPNAKSSLLFGGESAYDAATQIYYDSDETWLWTGATWKQIFPSNHPPERAAHGIVYDSIHSRMILFGGRHGKTTADGEITFHNDTWIWNGSNWSQVSTPSAPEPRQLFAMAYDSVRDRTILYGGTRYGTDGKTLEPSYDTWEFDGTTWTKVADGEPKVGFPLMAYDVARNQTVLVGVDTDLKTLMYAYEAGSHTWKKLEPEKLPACVNDAVMTYRSSNDHVVLMGGICSVTTPATDQTWEWNGTNWAEVTTNNPVRQNAQAIAYDQLRDAAILFGGFQIFSNTPTSNTALYQAGTYRFAGDITRPSPRSLSAFRTDPVTKTVWLFGGLDEFGAGYIDDFDIAGATLRRIWGYRNGFWFPYASDKAPSGCEGPLAAYDTNRSKLVIACPGNGTFEFDGQDWTTLTPKNSPPARRFSAMVFDENLKKTVLFGGFDGTNYRSDTWTWDGSDWTEVKKNRPTNRSLMAMWYDPLQKKTILYAGLGRGSLDERITRYSDMYSFDGTGWTKMNVSTTPGERFGAQIAVDPRNGKLVLFGGLRSQLDTGTNTRTQFYDGETWIWDGAASTWTQLHPAVSPHARENGMMAFDPGRNEIVLFGGYAGFYYSDTWVFTGTNWTPRFDAPTRHRAIVPGREPVGPSGIDATKNE